MISEEEKEFLKENAYGKLPLVQLFPIERMSFPLFDFEAKRFKQWQEEVNIDAKILPSRVILDLNTNKAIVVTYYMDYDSCPFLKRSETQSVSGAKKSEAFLMNNRCLIYDKKRAFICRLFPFNKGPFLNTGEILKKEDMFGSCPSMKDIIKDLDDSNKKELVKQLHESFGEDFLDIIEYDFLTEWVNKLIITLMKEKHIKPAMNYPYNFLLKRINNSEKIDLTDFLEEKGIKTKEEIENLIKRFDNNIDAKERLNQLE